MQRLTVAAALLVLAACGSGSTPTTPNTPQANRVPVIASATVTPTFGIADLTPFNFAALASDPDGDAVTYSWNVSGSTGSGATLAPRIFSGSGGAGVATVTVNDGKGGTASTTLNYIVGSLTGRWLGTMPGSTITYTFLQSAQGVLTANWIANGATLASGQLDPALPNTIDAAGRATFRSKPATAGFPDFTITGDMDNTGQRFVGSVSGSGLSGPVVMTKQ